MLLMLERKYTLVDALFSGRINILDYTVRTWLHLQEVLHEIGWGKYYIIQLDATRAEKQIYYPWHIVFGQDIILE